MSATSTFMPAGANSCATRSAMRLKEPLRRLPQMPSTLMSLIAYSSSLAHCPIDLGDHCGRRATGFLRGSTGGLKVKQSSRSASRQIVLQSRAIGGIEPQPELGAAPEDVVGAFSPFLAAEPIDLPGGETGAERLPQILVAPVLAQHRRGLAAVAAA